jgi:hypothetical protein
MLISKYQKTLSGLDKKIENYNPLNINKTTGEQLERNDIS